MVSGKKNYFLATKKSGRNHYYADQKQETFLSSHYKVLRTSRIVSVMTGLVNEKYFNYSYVLISVRANDIANSNLLAGICRYTSGFYFNALKTLKK